MVSERPDCLARDVVTIHLLDSALGHPLQTWRFCEKSVITVGRADDNDVVVADPHVSRIHAKLQFAHGDWTLVSVGRHGTLVDDRMVAETRLIHQMRFRLGGKGPTLRFDHGVAERRPTETIESSHPDFSELLDIDRARQQREADEIAGDVLFQQLREHVRRSKHGRDDDTNTNQAADFNGP